MPDREKVISELNEYIESALAICAPDVDYIPVDLLQYTVALLKEQEAVEGQWIVLEFCANEGIYCSECHMKIFDRTTKPKKKLSQYCPHCGSRNEQFFRDGEVVFR